MVKPLLPQYKKILLSNFWLKGHPNIFFESQSQFTRHNYKLNNVLCVLSDEALSSLRKWLMMSSGLSQLSINVSKPRTCQHQSITAAFKVVNESASCCESIEINTVCCKISLFELQVFKYLGLCCFSFYLFLSFAISQSLCWCKTKTQAYPSDKGPISNTSTY